MVRVSRVIRLLNFPHLLVLLCIIRFFFVVAASSTGPTSYTTASLSHGGASISGFNGETTTADDDLLLLPELGGVTSLPAQNQPSPSSPPSLQPGWGAGLPRATALFEFIASQGDELNLVCNERVVVLGPGDGDDWLKVGFSTL